MATRKKNITQQEKQDEIKRQRNAKANVSANANKLTEETTQTMSDGESVHLETILHELRGFRQDNKEQLEEIKEEIVKTNSRLDEAEDRITKAEERMQNTEDVLKEMLKLQTKLDEKITDQESRSRRDNVRIYGVPEGTEKEASSMISFVEKLLLENLDVPADMPLQIERAHRALGQQPPEGAQPRSILIKFLSFRTKETILRLAWQKKGFIWHGKQINLDNDYAPRILQKRREYAEIRKVLKDKQIPFNTLYPAKLKVRHADGIRVYETAGEASQDLSRRGLPVEVIKPAETLMDQLRQMSWERPRRRNNRRATHTSEEGFKERLQAFRREPSTQ